MRELIGTLNQLFDIFNNDFMKDKATQGERYVLARTNFEPEWDSEPYIQILATPSNKYLLKEHDEAIESGACQLCGVSILCTDKLAKCPVCGALDVECT